MKASIFNLHSYIVDLDNNIHLLMSNDDKKIFFPLYISGDQGDILISLLSNQKSSDAISTYVFFRDMWLKLGFEIKSIIIDQSKNNGLLSPMITVSQNQINDKYIYLTSDIPITCAFIYSYIFSIPIYITDRLEKNVRKYNISRIKEYTESIVIKTKE